MAIDRALDMSMYRVRGTAVDRVMDMAMVGSSLKCVIERVSVNA